MEKSLATGARKDLPGWTHERQRNREVTARLVLAMAHHQLRHVPQAREAFGRATELVQTRLPSIECGDLGREWPEWLLAHILLREAQGLMEGASTTSAEMKANDWPSQQKEGK